MAEKVLNFFDTTGVSYVGKLWGKAVGVNVQCDDLEDTLLRTFHGTQSTSVVLMGPEASGKSYALNCVLQRLKEKSSKGVLQSFLTIHVEGLLYGRNDALALKEICKQLCLVHEGLSMKPGTSFLEDLQFFNTALDRYSSANVPVVLILDHFERFASTESDQQKSRQSFLYNLFEILQNRNAQICVIGMTRKLNIFEMLEKRIVSRFSHRKILFTRIPFDTLKLILQDIFECAFQSSHEHFAKIKESYGAMLFDGEKEIQVCLDLGKSIPWFIQLMREVTRLVCECNVIYSKELLLEAIDLMHFDVLESRLEDCSILELCILAAVSRLSTKHNKSYNFREMLIYSFNLSLCYDEYVNTALHGPFDTVQKYSLMDYAQVRFRILVYTKGT